MKKVKLLSNIFWGIIKKWKEKPKKKEMLILWRQNVSFPVPRRATTQKKDAKKTLYKYLKICLKSLADTFIFSLAIIPGNKERPRQELSIIFLPATILSESLQNF